MVSSKRDKDFPSPKRGHQVLRLGGTTSNRILRGKVQTVPQTRSPTSHALSSSPFPPRAPRQPPQHLWIIRARLHRGTICTPPPPPPPALPRRLLHNQGRQDHCFRIFISNPSYDQHRKPLLLISALSIRGPPSQSLLCWMNFIASQSSLNSKPSTFPPDAWTVIQGMHVPLWTIPKKPTTKPQAPTINSTQSSHLFCPGQTTLISKLEL
jgi:hypothetical protein